MGLLKLLFELLEVLFVVKDMAGIVPFTGCEFTRDSGVWMPELSDSLSRTSIKEGGFEGVDLLLKLSELVSECNHLIDDVFRVKTISIHECLG